MAQQITQLATDDIDAAFVVEVSFADGIGHQATIFDADDVVMLLRAAVEREGSQTAFAKRYGVERTRINAILSGKRPVTESVANALGLRKTYTTK